MSLSWGGLSDYHGDWNPPHKSHSAGKVADIGFAQFAIGQSSQNKMIYDLDRTFLLQDVILADPNVAEFPATSEGKNMSIGGPTFSSSQPHFHVQFKQ